MEEIFPDMQPGESLNHYIQSNLRPTPQELSRFHNAIDQFVRFLQHRFSDPPFTVAKVLKGGSLGKGTALRDGSDIDLVVFVNGLHNIDDLKEHREKLIRRLAEMAKKYPQFQRLALRVGEPTKYAAKFDLSNIELDVLPAFDALREYSGRPRIIYKCMLKHFISSARIGQEFSASLAPLQVHFIKYLRANVKDVIRLVKHWKRENDLEIPSYCLELLTVKVWKDMGGTQRRPRPASTEEMFKRIIFELADFEKIKVAFGRYYSVTEHTKSLKPPYILDPANPTNNTLSRLSEDQREKIAAAAEKTRDILQAI